MLSGSTLLRHLAQFYCAIYTVLAHVVLCHRVLPYLRDAFAAGAW